MSLIPFQPKQRTEGYSRLIPCMETFYDYSTDDILYMLIIYFSQYDELRSVLFVDEKNIPKLKSYAQEIQEYKTVKTITKHLQDLREKGYIMYDNVRKRYLIKKEFDSEQQEYYQEIRCSIIYNLLEIKCPQTLKIFVYLYNKYLHWKTPYNFTVSELMGVLHYKNLHDTGARESIKKVLAGLCEKGFLNLSRYFLESERGYYTPYFVIDYMTDLSNEKCPFKPMKKNVVEQQLKLVAGVRKNELPENAEIRDGL